MRADELHYHVLKVLEQDPRITQRELSRKLGVSLGKTNYCLKALVEKGWVKARNFSRSKRKLSYAYILTPSGIQQKAELTASFLRRKQREFDELKEEIESLRREMNRLDGDLEQKPLGGG